MKTKGLVSVIVPVYNVSDYVGHCIESVVNQTYENIEIIVINDGSTDDSLSVCRTWEAKDSRVMVIDQENQGVSVARNAGLAACTGEWICFVDGDDWMETDAIERMLDCASDDTDILITDYYVNAVSKEWTESFFSLEDHDFSKDEHIELIKNCFIKTSFTNWSAVTMVGVPWAKIFRADVIKKNNINYDKNLRKMQDALFCSEAFENCGNVFFRKIPTYHYRQNNVSITHKGNAAYMQIVESVQEALDGFIKKYGYEKELRPVYYARKFVSACEAVKFIYILDDTGMGFIQKRKGIRELMNGLGIEKYEKEMLPYVGKAYRVAYNLHKMRMYGVMYLMMSGYYKAIQKNRS